MSFTDQDVREGRRLIDDGRENRLAIGDKLLAIAPMGHEEQLEAYCAEISLNPRTGRAYRHTARMCTPPVRQYVADSGIHVCYSVLREGARLMPSGKPYDENYTTLCSLLDQAREEGAGRVSFAQYQRALGTGPGLQDLLDPSGDTSVSDYLNALPPQQRDEALRDLVEEHDGIHDALKRVMDDKRRREREARGPDCGGTVDKAQALARDLVRLRDLWRVKRADKESRCPAMRP